MREFDNIFSLDQIIGEGATVLQDAMEKMSHGFAVYDANLNIVMYSRKFLELWGFTEEFVRANPHLGTLMRVVLLKTGRATESEIEEVIRTRLSVVNEGKDELQTLLMAPGDRWIENFACRTAAGRWVITYTDVTERLRAEQKLTQMATMDQLTGLPNRFQFFKLAGAEVEAAHRKQTQLPVLMLDLDHFKQINDSYGHAVGDSALAAVANAIRLSVRQQDILGRVGGEEFAAVLPETQWADARTVAMRIHQNVAKLTVADVGGLRLTVSIGMSLTRPDELTIDGALGRADEALYAAKKNGRNRIEQAVA